ncbi:hypothetical protein [Pelagibacterium lacus]|nr:hypothetical protein [Pelagibacterium lacus]
MPTEYRPSGPTFTRNNETVTPMAPVYFCEECGHEGAGFGQKHGDHVLSYCGWRDGRPVCVGKGERK